MSRRIGLSMIFSAAALRKAWIGVLIYLASLSLVGAFAIPDGKVAIQWSWGDWTPVGYAPKPLALLAIPLIAALMALAFMGNRKASGLEFSAAPFVWAEILAMVAFLVGHSLVVLLAI